MKSSRSLNKLFEEAHDDLAMLITRTRQLRRWTGVFRNQVGADLAPHCYLGRVEEKTLTVYVDSAVWATRLRFEAPQLIPVLQQANPIFSKLTAIQVKVLPPAEAPSGKSSPSEGPSMSKENANGINVLSDSIEDPALQQALQRLARHAKSE